MPTPDQITLLGTLKLACNWWVHKKFVIPILIYLGLLILYLAFPTKNYYWDGIAFAQTIEETDKTNSTLIHPNHLFYNVLGYHFYHLLRAVGFDVRALTALRVLNSVASPFAAFVFFTILKSLLRSVYLATCLTLLFALSATWWKFSTDANAYILSVLFVLFTFYFLLPDRRSRPFLIAVLLSIAMCIHQLAVFFGPVVVLGLFFQETQLESKKTLVTILKFSLVTVVLTSVAYIGSYCFTNKVSLGSFMRWVTSYSSDASFTFNIWNDLRYSLRGHVRLFFSGRFNLLKGLVNPYIVVLMLTLAVSFISLCYLTIKHYRKPRLESLRSLISNSRRRPLVILSVTWVGIYVAFLFFWLPQNTFYRLFYLPALILLVGLLASARYDFTRYKPTYRLAAFTVVLGLANFLFLIFPYAHVEKFPPARFALEMSRVWPEETVIFYDVDSSDKSLVRYFAPAKEWRPLTKPFPNTIEDELQRIYSQGSTAWLETTALDRLTSTAEGARWLDQHKKPGSHRALNDQGFRIEFVQVLP